MHTNTAELRWGCFRPELVLCATIVALLFWRLLNCDRISRPVLGRLGRRFYRVLHCLATVYAARNRHLTELFTGLLVYDQFTVFFRLFLLLFVILVICAHRLDAASRIDEDGPDFYTLLLGFDHRDDVDGQRQSSFDIVPRRGNDQCAQLCDGGLFERQKSQQRSRFEICSVWCGSRRGDAVRHQPVGGSFGNGQPARTRFADCVGGRFQCEPVPIPTCESSRLEPRW